MKPIQAVLVGGTLVFASAGVVMAQTAGSGGSATTSTTTSTQSKVDAGSDTQVKNIETRMQSSTNAKLEADLSLQPIRERAKRGTSKAVAAAEKKLTALAERIDAYADEIGEVTVAGRVAPEFSLTGEAMIAEHSEFSAGMGDLVIAHTMQASAKEKITMRQLFTLRQEGLSWGRIAYGLALNLDGAATAVRTEADVASGAIAADGKPAMIRGTQVAASAATKSSVGTGPVGAGATSNVGVGVNLGK